MAIPAAAAETHPGRPWYRHLYAQVLVAIVAGVLVGHFAPATGEALKPLGDLFIKLVKMVIAPVIFLTIVTGIAGMRDLGAVGRVAARAFAYFLFFSTFALVVGLIVGNTVRPGAGLNIDPASLDPGKVSEYAAKAHESGIVPFLLDVVPETFPAALTGGNVLQVLLVAILFGVALALTGERGERVLGLFNALAEVFFRVVAIVMKAAPIGAFGPWPSQSASMASASSPISPGWSPPST